MRLIENLVVMQEIRSSSVSILKNKLLEFEKICEMNIAGLTAEDSMPIMVAMSAISFEAKAIQHRRSTCRSLSVGWEALGKSSKPEVNVLGLSSKTALALRPRHLKRKHLDPLDQIYSKKNKVPPVRAHFVAQLRRVEPVIPDLEARPDSAEVISEPVWHVIEDGHVLDHGVQREQERRRVGVLVVLDNKLSRDL